MNKEKALKRIENAEREAERIQIELAAAKAELEALDKPKLRHGDIRRTCEFNHIILRTNSDLPQEFVSACLDPKGGLQDVKNVNYTDIIADGGKFLFNLADDLTELAKPLEEFEMEDWHRDKIFVSVNQGDVRIRIVTVHGQDMFFDIAPDQAKDFSMKLRRVILAAELK